MIEPIHFFAAMRRRWRLIVVLAVVGAVVALVIPTSTTKHAKTPLKWETYAVVGSPSSGGLLTGNVTNAQILFYANTLPVRLGAVDATGLAGSPFAYIGGMFGSTVGPSTKGSYPTTPATTPTTGKAANIGEITLYAAAQTPELAAKLANSYAKGLGNYLQSLANARAAAAAGTTGSGTTTPGPVITGYQVIFPGTPQGARHLKTSSASLLDSHKVRLVVGLVAGALVALLIILLAELLDKTIRRSSRAAANFKFPVIADVPETYPPDPGVVDVVDRPSSPAAEAYRKLRMSVLFGAMAAEAPALPGSDPFADLFGGAAPVEPYEVPASGSRSVLLMVSSMDEPSRPKAVANLAATFAEAGERVIVISTSDLDIGTAVPAEGVLTGELTTADIESRMIPAGPENVWMLSMRHFMRNSGQLVSRSAAVFGAARQEVDVVLVEAPSFLRYHHGEAMVHSVDVVVVVAEKGVTRVPDAHQMGDDLRRLGAPVLGVVFTGEELPAAQRKVLDAGMAAAVRAPAIAPGGAAAAPTDPGSTPGDDDSVDTTREFHPS